jgi:hypothetical protein
MSNQNGTSVYGFWTRGTNNMTLDINNDDWREALIHETVHYMGGAEFDAIAATIVAGFGDITKLINNIGNEINSLASGETNTQYLTTGMGSDLFNKLIKNHKDGKPLTDEEKNAIYRLIRSVGQDWCFFGKRTTY